MVISGPSGLARGVHLHHSAPNVHLPFHIDILECLLAKPVLAQSLVTACHRTVRGTRGEDPVHAGLAHLVVAFGIDEKSHVWVQIPRGFADRAHLC